MSTRKWYLTLVLALALIVSACGPAQTPAPTQPPAPQATQPPPRTEPPPATPEPAILRIGWSGAPDSLNPAAGLLSEAYTIYELTYDTLIGLDLSGKYYPELAESWEVSDDGTVWTFHLREGVKFHDGTDFTAEDMAFTIQFYKDHEEFPYLNTYTLNFEKVEATDDSTLVITLGAPIGNMESQVLFLYALPKHVWEGIAFDEAIKFENLEMIGTGPFKVVNYVRDQSIELAANTDHYLNPPKIDRVIFQTYESSDALVQALREGQADLITDVPQTTIASLKQEANITVQVGGSRSLRDIIFNVVPDDKCPAEGGVCSGHPAIKDKVVRQALAHATDKQQIIDVALLGLGTPGLSLVPRSLGDWFNSELEDYAYDVDLANKMLDDAGYKDTDGDGVREMPDGSQPLQFRFLIPSDIVTGAREGDLLKAMWAEVGVAIDVQVLEPDTVTAACCPAFDYDVLLWGWGADPDPAWLLDVLRTDNIDNGFSETGYSNPVYDQLFVDQSTAVDHEARKAIIWEMQKIALEDVPYIIPYYQNNVMAYRSDKFTGYVYVEGGLLSLDDPLSLSNVEPVR
ncbi:MAG TPA: ABC transporter substrate-binding protein [Anaerolineae bacterium]|nr:ABC transporter substrate-binding protein [Anaerolineae bacterium]